VYTEILRQAHRETDRFFAASGVQSAQFDRDFFHFRRAAFSSMFKSRVSNSLAKAASLRQGLLSSFFLGID
jgi:hypothetical protein